MGVLRPNLEEYQREEPSKSSAKGNRIQLKPDDEMKRRHSDFFDRKRNPSEKNGGGVWEYPPPPSPTMSNSKKMATTTATIRGSSSSKVIIGFDSSPTQEQGFGFGSRDSKKDDKFFRSTKKKISPLSDILSDPNNDGLLHYTSDDNNSSKNSSVVPVASEEHSLCTVKHECTIYEFPRKIGVSIPVPIPGARKDESSDCSTCKNSKKSWDGSPPRKKAVAQLLTLSPLGRSKSDVWDSAKISWIHPHNQQRVRSVSLEDDYEFRDDRLTLHDAALGGSFRNTKRSLVGSFEESLLSGRFLAGKSCQRLDGFLALLSVTGGSWSPQMRKLPFSVSCVDGDSCLLYYASIDIVDPKAKVRQAINDESRTWKGHRFRVPIRGRIQLVVSNPEKTPVHTFICGYDLTDMPPGTKTFMRQKTSLASTLGKHKAKDDLSCGRRLFKNDSSGDDRKSSSDLEEVAERIGIISRTSGSNICSSENIAGSCQKERYVHSTKNNRDNKDQEDKRRDFLSQQQQQEKKERNLPVGASGTVLRYALHMRFMCTPLKKEELEDDEYRETERKARIPDCTTTDKRRFYLYGDLRVVFPQRQSDSDEGKMKVEYDFPSDPRYFEYI